MEISFEPWKKLVVHEVVEYTFEDLVNETIASIQAVGTGMRTLHWANGVAFQAHVFPDTDTIVQEKLKGIIHYASVTFALKERFEKQVIRGTATINFLNVSVNNVLSELTIKLKGQSKYKTPST